MQCIQGSRSSPLVSTQYLPQEREHNLNGNGAKNSETDISIMSEKCLQSDYAVQVRNLSKSYNKNGPAVVKNLCMNVRKGTIYGLLGSSGCGKTTVLSCIVGLKKWDSGDVLVFGEKPGSKESGIPGKTIGYMPQDLALYNQLSIREIIQFYGRIYNMSTTQVSERWNFFIKLLKLPTNFKLISDLSGGQKRRASLALALLHSPEMLVLDEPTVGLDPVLRESIWIHLRNIVNTLRTTIIITTHYVEESRLSDTIGFMRNGQLLVEDSPSNLLTSFKCELLEQVVLQLCRAHACKNKNNSAVAQLKNRVEFKSSWSASVDSVLATTGERLMTLEKYGALKFDSDLSKQLQQRTDENNKNLEIWGKIENSRMYHALRRIYGLTTVLLLTFLRYPVFLGFLLIMPSIQGAITLWAVGPKPKELGFGIINHDVMNWTEECTLAQHSGNFCDFSALSCKYINLLAKDNLFALKQYATEQEALEQAHLGHIWGYLTFPYNFTQNSLDRVSAGRFALNESLEGSDIHVRLDYSQSIAHYFMVKNLLHSYLNYGKQLVEACDLGGQRAQIPLHFKRAVYGDLDDDFTTFIMPGVIITFLFGIPSAVTTMLYVTDRNQGTLSRAVAAGLTAGDFMASHLITQGIFVIGQFVVWCFVVHYLFGITNNGSLWVFLMLCMLASLTGTGHGFFFGTFCNNPIDALVIAMFLMPIYLLFGGTFFPLENMSKFWQGFGSILPTTLSTVSLRSVIVRGVGVMHPTVWPGLLILLGWLIALSILSWFKFKKS